ncbi:FKBP-type peptidyl-prolyl cis-trans isomerase [Enhygromyxa salina]|uniref:Peptidyl-prolyl cis-trans isomerase n=1 Tax=Enhygromyxa salina TaxID=215803 RepID=A0A0C2CR43_9BACT|nr:FKBP-type peptidyl-prolyl cis-trans isomerase [Enhygromyxa salina]KIG12160.1 FKBP-type peptidyl-prolyl cis-trans isomerase [Enhygromyxa salina]
MRRSSLVPLLLLALGLLACAKQPAPREAYEGAPVRAAINPDCDAETLEGPRGLPCVQIDVFAEGEGPSASDGEWLKVHYIVLLPNGSVLDSSHDRGKPLSVQLNQSGDVIDGMHLGLEGMRLGERRRFVVPPRLAYRGRKMPGLPPDANLTFLVELVERRASP